MRRPSLLGSGLAVLCLLAACGGQTVDGTAGSAGAVSVAADPHPCDLLSIDEAAGVLSVSIVKVSRFEADASDGGQASCAWAGTADGMVLGLIVEGPAFFASAPDGYTGSAEAYRFWREDTLDAGFSVIDVEGAGDAAFMPAIGPDPPNTLVMRCGEYLVHVSMLGPGGEARMTEAARLAAAALERL